MKLVSLFVVMLASLALVACGGNDANTAGTNSGSACTGGKEPEKAPTPEELRKDVANKMMAAMVALDDAALKNLFAADEQAKADERIGAAIRKLKADGFTVKAGEVAYEEKDGKFFATFPHTITKDGQSEEKKSKLSFIEVEGKWYLSWK